MNAGAGAAAVGPLRLNLGAGEAPLAGYRNLDGKNGDTIYPLDYAEGSVDEIRASHILEHFSHREVLDVLKNWTRALKWDGTLKIAVPDFEKIATAYLAGEKGPWQGYTMGGHLDIADRHGAIFDRESLTELMAQAGLREIEPWQSEIQDCASLPISLNLQGRRAMKVAAVMSVPRLGFQDNFFTAFNALVPMGISLTRCTGAFWGQCLDEAITKQLTLGNDAILTLDYDSVFSNDGVRALIKLLKTRPEIDALAAIQQARSWNGPLMRMNDPATGKPLVRVGDTVFKPDTAKIANAHFGLTLIRAKALLATPKPWFQGVPAPDGTWGEGHIDDDIWFWKQFEKAGHELHLANRVVAGHLELMIRWPDESLQTIYQHPNDYFDKGPPEKVWK